MKKMIVSVMTVVSMVVMLALSSCTVAGAECGLLGKWDAKILGVTVATLEFKADDSIGVTVAGVSGKAGKITKADSVKKTITLELLDVEKLNGTFTYSLDGDSLKIGSVELTKVK